jgi:hypothetical protein
LPNIQTEYPVLFTIPKFINFFSAFLEVKRYFFDNFLKLKNTHKDLYEKRIFATSLVQLNVAAILGIGVAKLGFKNIFRKTEVNKFFILWIISPLIAFSLSFFLIFIADKMNLI